MKRRMPRRGRGTLHLIAMFFAISAFVRLGMTGQAMAGNTTPQPEEPPQAEMAAKPSENTDALLRAFEQREARLAAREAQLIDRIQALRIAEVEVAEQLVALREAEESLAATIALADVAAETDIGTLVEVYENMKPKDAAELFEQMPPEFAAGFLGMMNAEAAAQIMTLVPPDVSYSISVVLAGRNANVPTQ